MNYDKAKYHFEPVFEAGLNIKSAYTHGGMLLEWLIENNLISDDFAKQNKNEIIKLKNGNITGSQLYIIIDGVISDFELNDEGIEFLNSYYNENYLEDYVCLFNEYNSIYNVTYNLENYKKLSLILYSRFLTWKENRTKAVENEFDYIREFTLKCLGNDFKFIKKDKYGLLFVKEIEENIQGFRVFMTIEKFTSVTVFYSDKTVMTILDSQQNIYSDWILGANQNDFLFDTKLKERFPNGNDGIYLTSVDKLIECTNYIADYIEEKAKQFFNTWQNITNILPYLETKDNSIISDVFSGHGFYKKIIIWKLCSHTKYKELTNEMLNIFSQELKDSPNDKLLKKDYELYLKILEKLGETKPKYSWKEDYLSNK